MSKEEPSSFNHAADMTMELSPDDATVVTNEEAASSPIAAASGLFKDEEGSSSKSKKPFMLFFLGGFLLAALIATAVAVPLSQKKKQGRSLCVAGQVEDLKDTMITITIDGIDREITPSEEKEIQHAVTTAYNYVSGGCEDIYNRWMYDSWIVDQEVVNEGGVSSLSLDVLTTVSCDGCPDEESFASTFGEAANEVLGTRKLRDVDGKTVDAVEVIEAIQKNIMKITPEAEGVSRIGMVSAAAPDTQVTANLSEANCASRPKAADSGSNLKITNGSKNKGKQIDLNICAQRARSSKSSKAPSTKTPKASSSKSPNASSSKSPNASSSKSPKASSSKSPKASSSKRPKASTTRFDITLVQMGVTTPDAKFTAAFLEAKARWEAIIIGDLPDQGPATLDWFRGTFLTGYTAPIDDIAIGYSIEKDDGPGDRLGFAGCTVSAGNRCLAGIMKFDVEDFAVTPMEDIKAIILHEMGHVLGLVGVSGPCQGNCASIVPGQYTYGSEAPNECLLAVAEFNKLVGTGTTSLLLENDGNAGNVCGHWEEDTFRTDTNSELMTSTFEENLFQPISRVTVGALDDLGVYTVNYDAADPWPMTQAPPDLVALPNITQAPSVSWEVTKTVTSFNLAEMMGKLPPPVDIGNNQNNIPLKR